MLGKLIKHEFRATGRVMLPMMGVLALLALLANLSIRGLSGGLSNVPALRILFILIVVFFGIGIVAAAVMSVVIMVSRFYRNLLKDEGYLMFTLPVSVHEIIWSKLIVSLVWFLATALLIFLVLFLTGLNLAGTNLEMIIAEFPSWAEIRAQLDALGIRGQIWGLGIRFVLTILLGGILCCLHFYAAMSLGHMFSKSKVLLSVVFFIAISFAFNLMEMGWGLSGFGLREYVGMDEFSVQEGLHFASRVMLAAGLMEAVQGALLYLATALGLKRGLNLG